MYQTSIFSTCSKHKLQQTASNFVIQKSIQKSAIQALLLLEDSPVVSLKEDKQTLIIYPPWIHAPESSGVSIPTIIQRQLILDLWKIKLSN